MKLKNRDALVSILVLKNTKETGKLGFAIAKNARKLSEELVEYNNIRDGLLEKYGKDDGYGEFTLTKDNLARLNEELEQYSEIEIDFEPMTVDEETFYGGNLTSDQMYALMWMVKQ